MDFEMQDILWYIITNYNNLMDFQTIIILLHSRLCLKLIFFCKEKSQRWFQSLFFFLLLLAISENTQLSVRNHKITSDRDQVSTWLSLRG